MTMTIDDIYDGNGEITILANGHTKTELPSRPVNLWTQGFMALYLAQKNITPTAWVDLHQPIIFTEEKAWNPDYLDWLKTRSVPIIMWDQHDEIPMSVEYPKPIKDAAQAKPNSETSGYPWTELWSPALRAPFSGTLDWLVALAIYLGAKTINLYGCDYVTLHERLHQTFGLAYWIGIARGMGITVNIPPSSRLLWNIVPGNYGPDYPPWPAVHDPRIEFYGRNPLVSFSQASLLYRQSKWAPIEATFVRQGPKSSSPVEGPQETLQETL